MALPDLVNVMTYLLGIGLTYAAPAVQEALTAETAAQSRVCRVGDPMEADLAESLRRRVARNLTMRALPLGVMSDEVGSTVLGSNDAEIRRLEKPFRKLVSG